MKAPKTAIVLFLFALTFLFCLCNKKTVSPLTVSTDIKSVVEYLKAEDYQHNKSWHYFPGTDTSAASDTLKRLGLPIHGRWIRTYVNQIAFDFINDTSKSSIGKEPFKFPPGSFIVKENYRSNPDAMTVSKDESMLAILTIMFKPDPKLNFCATKHLVPHNGVDCYGGEWFYGFYKTEGGEMLIDSVQKHVNAFCINCHSPAYKTDYVRTLNSLRDPFSQPTTKPYCDQFEIPQASMKSNYLPSPLSDVEKSKIEQGLKTYCTIGKLSPELPSDVPFDPTIVFSVFGHDKTQEMFDCYAWKTFISLNWANKSPKEDGTPQRGEADPKVAFTSKRDGPTVWETFKPTFEVFQPDIPDWDPGNQAWNQIPPLLAGIECATDTDAFVLTMKSKTRDVGNETGQAFAGSFGFLVDRNKNLVRYEVLFNRTEFEYLIDDNRATTKYLTPGGPKDQINKIKFPDTSSDPLKVGAMEVKSAWKELCFSDSSDCAYPDAPNLKAAKEKYYVRKVIIYDEDTKSCRSAYAGLIGLHIARKTYFAPQWIWMTFEHKDNVPAYRKSDQANFYDPNHKASENCWKFPFLDTALVVKFCPNVDLNRFIPQLKDQPNQLTRLVPIEAQAAKQNALYASQIRKEGGSPFANYLLVDAQWPLNGRNQKKEVVKINCADNLMGKDCFTMVPFVLRNTVIESYMATYCSKNGKNIQISNRSCMGCHGEAGADFSYIWLDAVSQRVGIVGGR